MDVQLPTNASDFISFMGDIWLDNCKPTEDGGIFMTWNKLYDKYADAISTVQLCGAVRTGGTRLFGEFASVFMFPDASRVTITSGGHSCHLTRTRFRRFKKNRPSI